MATGAAHRLRLWWRWRGGRDRAIAASGLALLLLALLLTVASRSREPVVAGPRQPVSDLVGLTLLRNAEEKGAVCLDGSPPGYHLQRGYGSGSDSWLLHLEGGGWCRSLEACSLRKTTPLGSSHYMEHQVAFNGILSSNKSQNPDFYNWNKVKVRYCDGASFSGDVESEVQNGTKLFFRGERIWEAVIGELLLKGLANAKQAFLTGCSAGGLATFIHCDDFRALLPKEVSVKCLADGGFFLDELDISKKRSIRSYYNDVVHLQDVGKKLHNCTSRMEASQCFFPREIIKSIRTPLFIVNPAYDSWQIQYVLTPDATDDSSPQRSWLRCRLNIQDCDSDQLESLQGFRTALLNALSEFQRKSSGGMFIDSCFVHCQTIHSITWHSSHSSRINNKTIAEAVGDWFFNRKEVKEIDCPYPCNPTCCNLNLTQPYSL